MNDAFWLNLVLPGSGSVSLGRWGVGVVNFALAAGAWSTGLWWAILLCHLGAAITTLDGTRADKAQ